MFPRLLLVLLAFAQIKIAFTDAGLGDQPEVDPPGLSCRINFLTLGDWGKGGWSGSTSGSRRRLLNGETEQGEERALGQSFNQGKVASAMASVASSNEIDFIAALGGEASF